MKRKFSGKSKKSNKRRRGVKRTAVSTVKRTLLKMAETKRLSNYVTGQGLAHSSIKSYNLMYQTANVGTGERQFIGDSFYLSGIKVSLDMINYAAGGASYSDSPTSVKVMVVAAKHYTTGTLSTGDVFDTAFTNGYNNFKIDSNKAKVLATRRVTFTPQIAGAKISRGCKIWVPIKKTIKFKDWTVDYQLKGWNYYVVVFGGNESFNVIDPTIARFTANFELYIKDM